MTPLAARMFKVGAEPVKRDLLQSQFFECTALVPFALEMRSADKTAAGFSPDATLPAPKTFIEAIIGGHRRAFLCFELKPGSISVRSLAAHNHAIAVVIWNASFRPGTQEYVIHDADDLSEAERAGIVLELLLVEKLLLILFQPGLVDRAREPTDKRIIRAARDMGFTETPASVWHRCAIRPGKHGVWGDEETELSRERPLHYVRKHFKPSIDKNIEGYWRGNADLGVSYKWYKA